MRRISFAYSSTAVMGEEISDQHLSLFNQINHAEVPHAVVFGTFLLSTAFLRAQRYIHIVLSAPRKEAGE